MKDEKEIMVQLSAFRVFKTKGLSQAKRLYPEAAAFVEANQSKSYEAVKKELQQSKAYAHSP